MRVGDSVVLDWRGDLEDNAAVIVLFLSRGQVEVGQGDFAGMTWGEVDEGGIHDGVVSDFKLVAVFEDKDGGDDGLGIGDGVGSAVAIFLMCRRGIVYGRNIGAFTIAAAIENCWATLIIGIVFLVLVSLAVWSVVGRVRNGYGVIVIRVSEVVILAMMAVMAIAARLPQGDGAGGTDAKPGRIAAGSKRGDARRGTVDRTSAKARGRHRRGRRIDLSGAAGDQEQGGKEQGRPEERSRKTRPHRIMILPIPGHDSTSKVERPSVIRLREKRSGCQKTEVLIFQLFPQAGHEGEWNYNLRMNSVVRFVLLALVLVIVAMVSALTAMRFAIHGQEVTVPALVGQSPGDAERAAAGLGLRMSIERQYYSPQVPEGKIMSQLPLPGTKVRRGWQVRVAQSLGPTRVAIPDVAGQSEHAAELNIRRRGLDIASVAQVGTQGIPPDQVLAQNPPANAGQVLAPKISLLVTSDAGSQAFVMPSFVGQPLGTVSRTLQDAGFRLGNVTEAPAPAPAAPAADQGSTNAGTPGAGQTASAVPQNNSPPAQVTPASIIVSQVPGAGQKVLAGATITFQVR